VVIAGAYVPLAVEMLSSHKGEISAKSREPVVEWKEEPENRIQTISIHDYLLGQYSYEQLRKRTKKRGSKLGTLAKNMTSVEIELLARAASMLQP